MSIENRIARLEKSASRWRGATFIIGLILVALVFNGAEKNDLFADPKKDRKATQVDVLYCRELQIRGQDGSAVAWFSDKDGVLNCHGINVMNPKREVVAYIGEDGNASYTGWSVLDQKRDPVCSAGWNEKNGAWFRMGKAGGRFSLSAAVNDEAADLKLWGNDMSYASMVALQSGGMIDLAYPSGHGHHLSPDGKIQESEHIVIDQGK